MDHLTRDLVKIEDCGKTLEGEGGRARCAGFGRRREDLFGDLKGGVKEAEERVLDVRLGEVSVGVENVGSGGPLWAVEVDDRAALAAQAKGLGQVALSHKVEHAPQEARVLARAELVLVYVHGCGRARRRGSRHVSPVAVCGRRGPWVAGGA